MHVGLRRDLLRNATEAFDTRRPFGPLLGLQPPLHLPEPAQLRTVTTRAVSSESTTKKPDNQTLHYLEFNKIYLLSMSSPSKDGRDDNCLYVKNLVHHAKNLCHPTVQNPCL